ncbi:hypothetical protein BHE74_00046250 [Ensete ventricosum]|nr:hypothetical protein BHE74_00046250 [Ensete ventricosum]
MGSRTAVYLRARSVYSSSAMQVVGTHRPLPGGFAKNQPSAVDFDRRRPIDGEIDRRRSIEQEKGKKKKKKRKRRKNTYLPRVVVAARGLRALFLPCREKDRGDIAPFLFLIF